jgi:hypothetical protein
MLLHKLDTFRDLIKFQHEFAREATYSVSLRANWTPLLYLLAEVDRKVCWDKSNAFTLSRFE